MTKNPIQIWNDSYGFIKNNTEQLRSKRVLEYEDVIYREHVRCDTMKI